MFRSFALRLISMLLILVCTGSALAQPAAAQLPIVSIEADSLTGWEGKKDKREARLRFYDPSTKEQFERSITIRPQGTSSLGYEKKNFTIELQDEGVLMRTEWGTQSHFCLKADFIDPTHAGNVVSARLAAKMQAAYGLFPDAPNRGLIDGFPIWVYLNRQNAGIYNWNIPKDAWMFGMDPENENHLVLCSEGWQEPCVFYADTFETDTDWSFEAGEATEDNIEKFNRVLKFINSSSDEEFRAHFDEYLNFDACLNYFCFALIAYGCDNMGKNMLMATYDGKVWSPSLYDLDSMWGIDYKGTGRMEEVSSVWDMLYGGKNHLMARLLNLFPHEFRQRYTELRLGILSDENILAEFAAYVDDIPTFSYQLEQSLWYPDDTYIRTIDRMAEEMQRYLPRLDSWLLKTN